MNALTRKQSTRWGNLWGVCGELMGRDWDKTIAGEYEPPPPKAGARKPHWIPVVITRPEIRELLAAPHMHPLELLALRTLYASGIEARELVLLKREHLQTETASLRFGTREAMLDRDTCGQLASLDWSQWHWTARAIDGVLERAAKELVGKRYAAMGRKLRPQALRIAFAAHCLENGAGLFSLHDLLGFAQLNDTENVIEIAVGLWLPVYDKAHPLAVAAGQAKPRGGQQQSDLSLDEVLRMIHASGVGAKGQPNWLMLRIIYAAGLRVSELTKLLAADIEVDERRLFLRDAKEAKDRYTLIDSQTAENLRDLVAGMSPDTAVFPCSDKYIRDFVKAAGKATGLLAKFDAMGRTLSPHTFRRAHATHLYAGGMEPGVIKKLLGHDSVKETMHYVACGPAEWRAAYDRCQLLS